MSKLHPGVCKISKILNLLSNYDGKSLTYFEIARMTNLSRSSCHMVLNGLVDVGYLMRLSDKSFVIGPGFDAVSLVAARIFPEGMDSFQGKDARPFVEVEKLRADHENLVGI